MLAFITTFSNKHKKLISNFSSLSVLQVFNLVLPLVTYPYLIRVLGPEKYGLIIFAQSIVAYLTIMVNFGFNITATREVALSRNDEKLLSQVVSVTLSIKFLILCLALVFLFFLVAFVEPFNVNKLLFIFVLGPCIYELLFPVWFFQGIEEMKYIALINVFIKFLSAVSIFVFISSEEHYLRLPLINLISFFIGGGFSLWVVFNRYNINFKKPSFFLLKKTFIKAIPVFFSSFVNIVRERTFVIFIGAIFGYTQVAYFDLAQKLYKIFLTPIHILSTSIYPKVANERNIFFMKKVLKIVLLFVVFGYMGIYILSEYIIVKFAGTSMLESANLLKIICIALPFSAIACFYGDNGLIVLEKNILFMKSSIYTLLFFVVMLILGYYFYSISLLYLAIILVLTQVFEGLIRVFYFEVLIEELRE